MEALFSRRTRNPRIRRNCRVPAAFPGLEGPPLEPGLWRCSTVDLRCTERRSDGTGSGACTNAASQNGPRKPLQFILAKPNKGREGSRLGYTGGAGPNGARMELAHGGTWLNRTASLPGERLRIQRTLWLPGRRRARQPEGTALAHWGYTVHLAVKGRHFAGHARPLRWRPWAAPRRRGGFGTRSSGGVPPGGCMKCSFGAWMSPWEPWTAQRAVPFLSPECDDPCPFPSDLPRRGSRTSRRALACARNPKRVFLPVVRQFFVASFARAPRLCGRGGPRRSNQSPGPRQLEPGTMSQP